MNSQITVILNCYRRPQYLREQLDAIKKQSIPAQEIWLWVNDHVDNHGWDFDSLGFDKIIRSNHNFKFHGRFSAACLVRTPFVALFDDDTIPGENWFKNCLSVQDEIGPCILGGVGLVFTGKKYWDHQRVGWPSMNEVTTEVDLVGHAWFFPRFAMRYFWLDTFTLDNCEDLQLSYTTKKYGSLKTYCPPHPEKDKTLWSSLHGIEKGTDSKASSNGGIPHHIFYYERDKCVELALQNGWETVGKIKL
jgi:hypothetical protein